MQSQDESLPIPYGVEHLLDTPDIQARIAYIRRNLSTLTTDMKPTVELRRLVEEESRRELRRLGVIS